jgi:hypothetical protein
MFLEIGMKLKTALPERLELVSGNHKVFGTAERILCRLTEDVKGKHAIILFLFKSIITIV